MEATAQDSPIIHVRFRRDAEWCSLAARQFAEDVGFGRREALELAIVASELASNILNYAGRGEIVMRIVTAPAGIELIARDDGPGIDDIDRALRGGAHGRWAEERRTTETEGLGQGLGAVRRLTDSFAIKSARGEGTTVVVRKWRVLERGRTG